MSAPLVIARKDLRQRIRDRSALVIGVLAPVAIAALMSLAFRGADTFHYSLGLVDQDHGQVAAGLVRELRAPALQRVLKIRTISSEAEASAAVKHNKIAAALVIPAGFSAGAIGSAPIELRTLSSVNNTLAANVTESLASSFVAQINADRLAVSTALAAGAPASRVAELTAAAAKLRIPENLVQRPLGARPIKAVSYYAPAMGIFFLLFTISFTARSFFVDRSQGMIERMRAAPIRPLQILVGKASAVFVFGVVSLAVIAVVTSAAFGADWGSPLPAATVCLAMVIAVVCLTMLVIGVSRSQRQAEGIASAVVFGLALLGGNFTFLSAEPALMRRMALFTPNGWALRALTDLSTTGGGMRAVAVPVLAILAFSAVVGGVAARLAPRAMTA